RKAFSNDPEVRAWVQSKGQADGDFEKLLASTYPSAYARSLEPLEEGRQPRVLEAIGEGVLFTTLEHSAAADSLSVLRPRLAKKEIAVALWRAFLYVGRPYDFNFDFMTDSAIVCTELVYKSYQPCADSHGLTLPLLNILGRLATPANELVHQFDVTYGTADQPYDLVLFLDGMEKQQKAVERNVDDFCKSWRRPKCHVLIHESPTNTSGTDATTTTAIPAANDKTEWAQAITLEGLPNLHKVTPSLYRGAQPTEPGFTQLTNLGVKTVINLRAFHSDRELLAGTGLNYEEISFKTWHPEEEDMVRFLQIVGNTNNAPVFVHCQHGADRTGMMCAIYRMVIGGWDKAAAIREMTEGGFGFHPIWSNLVAFLQKLDVEALRQKAFPQGVPSREGDAS
ncbi:MAG: tyrosine-protein phosphatase, partial [Lentisphaerota bacterium]